ncbi:MAG: glycosyltransferase family 4 protein [Chitinispirillaceae bacterium]
MKKVVFLTHWAQHMGGAEYSLLELLRYAVKQFDCYLVTTEDGPLVDRAIQFGVTHRCVPCSSQIELFRRGNLLSAGFKNIPALFGYIVFVIRLFFLLRKVNPDIIHANVPKSHISLGLLLRMGLHAEGVIHIREIFERKTFAYHIYSRLISRRIRGIAISHAVYRNLPSHMQKCSTVIYNGIHIPPAFPRYKRTYRPLRLLYLGRIVPWKGCHELLDIVEELLHTRPRLLTLSLVGNTAYWDIEYRNQLHKRIEESSCLHGFVTLKRHQDSIAEIFSEHDIFCTTSYMEPFGRSTAEAQAYGLPVIAYNSGGVDEVVVDGKSGILVKWQERAQFQKAIITISENRTLIGSMGAYGAKHAAANFESSRQGQKMIDFLMKLVDS